MNFFKKDISTYAVASFALASVFIVGIGGASGWMIHQAGKETLGFGLAGAAMLGAVVVFGLGWGIVRGLNRHLGGSPDEAIWTANKISQGNLSIDIKVRPDDQVSLVFALNKMRNSLTELVGQVRQGADTVAHTSTELAGNNSELSARTDDLVDALQQTNATIEQLTATIQQNADNAARANELADAASVSAASGGEVVSKAVAMMSELNQSSKKIVDIISVIDAIAFQTNLLALNATVEAAHAGDLGRGFAIVAAEVRNLAQRSASAAKEIRTLITNSVSKIENGSQLVNHAGERILELVDAVSDVRIVINEINLATQEQSQGLQHINGAVAKIDAVAQQNAAMVQSASEAAESLQDQAGTLAQLAGVFKLSNSALENVATKQPTRSVNIAPGKKGQDGFQPRLIRFGYGLEEQSNQGRASRFFAQDLAQRTGSKLKLKEFGNATLGNDDKMQQALIDGELEMMVGSTATLIKYVQDFGVFDLPFVFANENEADTIFDGQFGQELIAKLESKGLIGLVYWENGFRNLTNNVRPIKK